MTRTGPRWPWICRYVRTALGALAQMRPKISSLLDRLRPRRIAEPVPQVQPAEERQAARSLADAIDEAIDLRQLDRAERLCQTAARLASRHPIIADRIARVRLLQGRPEVALTLLETCDHLNAASRLLRAACLVRVGRRTEAISDLHQWSQRQSAPLDARVMLGLLEWTFDDRAAATQALRRNLRQLEDPTSLQVLLLIARESGDEALACELADRLRTADRWSQTAPEASILLTSLDLPATPTHASSEDQIATLAMELVACEDAIGAIVEAQQIEPNRDDAAILVEAITRAFPEFSRPNDAYEPLARLHLVLGDRVAAQHWLDKAIEVRPMSASLAMLAEQISGESTQVDAPVVDADVVGRIGTEEQEKAA